MSNCTDDSISIPEVLVTDVWVSGFNLDWGVKKGQIQLELSTDEAFSHAELDTLIEDLPVDIEGLTSSTNYFLRYKLVVGGSRSDFSETISIQTLDLISPQNVTHSQVIGDEIQLNWDEIQGVEYHVQVALDNDFLNLVIGFDQITIRQSSYTIEPLAPLTTYYIRIRSVNQNEVSDWVELDGITTTDLLFFKLKSTDFEDNGTIPFFLNCNGPPPELHWKNAPDETMSFAIVMRDLDFQNGFNHWILFNIPVATTHLPQGSTGSKKPSGSIEGTNDLGMTGYFGPCPPAGTTHRYVFTLYALDRVLTFDRSIRNDAFLSGIESSTLAISLLRGNYE